ncbi:hypothetical protein [Geodermatophilus sp. URMC 64]
MEPQNQEPEGDYGYDEVHADVRRPQRTEPSPQPEHRRAPAHRSPELDQDYGYDEAHSF